MQYKLHCFCLYYIVSEVDFLFMVFLPKFGSRQCLEPFFYLQPYYISYMFAYSIQYLGKTDGHHQVEIGSRAY